MKRKFFMSAMFIAASALYAQNDPKLPEVVPPSPTVANLMKFEEVPIDYYSGQPNISIPLFSKQIGSGLGVNIGLNYSTTGIQIDNRSGWTGTGWSLFAGGSISRTVRDVADEAKKNVSTFGNNTGVLNNSSYWNYSSTMPGLQEYLWKSVGDSQDKYDTNPDLYQFNFMGYTGRFIVVKNGSSLQAKLLSKTSNLKISLSYSTTPTYSINSFTITDTKGYKYTFDVREVTNYYTSTETLSQGTQSQISNGSGNTYTVNSAWHLSKVETPKGDDLVTFNYTSTYNEGYATAPSRIENTFRFPTTALNNLANDPYNQGVMEPKYSISQSSSTTATRKLSSIVFRDGTSVSLTNTSGHPEIGNGRILSSLVLKDVNNTTYKTYNFTYQTVASRLWLTRVSETAGSFTLHTDLSYHNKHLLPSFGNGVLQGDSWGYYSGIQNPLTFSASKIKTGLLTQIKYATGGVKEFEFEHNSYSYYGNTAMPSGDYHTFSTGQTNNTSITSEEMIGGGVRIKSVAFKDSPTALDDAKLIRYHYKLESSPNKSSGVIDAKQHRLTRDYIININKVFLPLSTATSQIQYNVKQWGPNMNAQMTKDNFVAYRHVKVEELKPALTPSGYENNGYTLYDYTSAFDFPTPSAVFSLPNSAPSPNLDYKRGLLKKQRVFNRAGNILKEVENTYSYQEDYIYKQRTVYRFEQTKQFYDTWNFYNSSQGNNAEINNIPNYSNYGYTPSPAYALMQDFNAGWAKKTQTKTKDYFYEGSTQSYTESIKSYDYNSSNYQIASETNHVEENGEDVYYHTNFYYPNNGSTTGTSSTVRNRLITLNKVTEVLGTVTRRFEGLPPDHILATGELMNTVNTIYGQINGDPDIVLPIRAEVAKGTQTPDSRIEFHNYDEYGNPLEVSQKDGTRIVYIWGYDKTLPVAKIENATYSQVSSYISNIQNKSNLDDDATIDSRNSNGDVTSYIGDEGQLRSALNNLRNVSALSNALITTFTFNPSVGVTSITDPSGETIYYLYDALHRLEMIKDAYGKVVSKNEYNYKN